jgi:hypothetical protein
LIWFLLLTEKKSIAAWKQNQYPKMIHIFVDFFFTNSAFLPGLPYGIQYKVSGKSKVTKQQQQK